VPQIFQRAVSKVTSQRPDNGVTVTGSSGSGATGMVCESTWPPRMQQSRR